MFKCYLHLQDYVLSIQKESILVFCPAILRVLICGYSEISDKLSEACMC